MSVLIKGMEMPKNCDDCRLGIDCAYDESQYGYKMMGGRPHNCPLVPVPPHGRLIDAEALKKNAYPFPCAIGTEWAVTLRQINDAPTIIQAEEGE